MDYCLPGSSVHGIFQARKLEWAAIFYSRVSSRPRDQTYIFVSCIGRQILYRCATWEAQNLAQPNKYIFKKERTLSPRGNVWGSHWVPDTLPDVMLISCSKFQYFFNIFLLSVFIYLTASHFSCDIQDDLLVEACRLWHAGLPCATWDLSSLTGYQTHVPYIARWILNRWTTKEVHHIQYYWWKPLYILSQRLSDLLKIM